MSSDVLLQVKGLTTLLGDPDRPARVVDGVDLTIRRGETFVLLGESGCGKSMTALSLMRLLPPSGRITEGTARLAGTDLLRLTEGEMRAARGGRMAMIFQEPQTSLNPVMSVGEQIAEAVRIHKGGSRDETPARVLELMRAVKTAFDPNHILHPGKLMDAPDDWLIATRLRYSQEEKGDG